MSWQADLDLLTTTAVVNRWIDDLRERGAVLRLVDGSACITWPQDLDTPGRRRDFALHQAMIDTLLAAEHEHAVQPAHAGPALGQLKLYVATRISCS